MGVLFKEVEHIIDRQYRAEQEFLAEYAKEKHTIANPYVKLNPYLIAPLTSSVPAQRPLQGSGCSQRQL